LADKTLPQQSSADADADANANADAEADVDLRSLSRGSSLLQQQRTESACRRLRYFYKNGAFLPSASGASVVVRTNMHRLFVVRYV
jgi:hypothetical protein